MLDFVTYEVKSRKLQGIIPIPWAEPAAASPSAAILPAFITKPVNLRKDIFRKFIFTGNGGILAILLTGEDYPSWLPPKQYRTSFKRNHIQALDVRFEAPVPPTAEGYPAWAQPRNFRAKKRRELQEVVILRIEDSIFVPPSIGSTNLDLVQNLVQNLVQDLIK